MAVHHISLVIQLVLYLLSFCWADLHCSTLCSSTCGSNLHIKAHVHNQHLNLFCERYLATMECIQHDCRTLMIQFVQIWSALQPDRQPFTECCWCICVFISFFCVGQPLTTVIIWPLGLARTFLLLRTRKLLEWACCVSFTMSPLGQMTWAAQRYKDLFVCVHVDMLTRTHALLQLY